MDLTPRRGEQISIFLKNRPGIVADVFREFVEDAINVVGLTVMDTVDVGTLRMVVDDADKAKAALEKSGARYLDVPVMLLPIPNVPGAFARVAKALADAGVNIEYVYATACPDQESAMGVYRVSDIERALTVDFSAVFRELVTT